MRIPINLASQPFRHNRALLIASSVLAIIMIATLVMLVSLARVDRMYKRECLKQIAVAQKQLDMIQKEQTAIEQDLRKPQNATVLEYSVLLNELLVRKGISWTRIFSDLEKIVPYNVRVLQIRPTLDSHNKIYLQMVVGADNTMQLNSFIEKLEASDVFGATMVPIKTPPSQTDPLYRYQVTVTYAQKL
jgi:short subunit fatty acids transporter